MFISAFAGMTTFGRKVKFRHCHYCESRKVPKELHECLKARERSGNSEKEMFYSDLRFKFFGTAVYFAISLKEYSVL